ncbi:carbohydrate ABC transporter permease [Mahella australiensis]|uniref:Carbohydrate ABC transporter membrane protein 1, CUT1 family n=1 Tax=Mahella australiensis (strain DSM 15567 / CIP 107919 / 50-1 BON) TaxID=697281 RepID=F4A333_MAHA5|nr:sugar ABC transporter permease [Mahella australiensis]AEE96266.1 carbohydrate ABC transporter membrane protein 1, CUT1 family [Mahella australiensis 50-1 BON]
MEKILRDKKAIFLFVFPAFFVFVVIVLLPIFVSIYYSLLDWDGISKGVFIGFKNYKDLFVHNTDGFMLAVRNSFILALLSVFIQLPISLFLALVLSREVKGEKFYRTVYFIPVILSTVVIGQLWMKIYNPDYGLLNFLLTKIGLQSLTNQWLGNPETALMAVFVPIVWQYIGYHMLLMYTSAKSIPTDIYEAAKIDGATESQIAFKITIPLMKPMLKVCVTFAVIGSFKTFDLIYVLTNGGPLHASEVPSTLMYNMIFFRYRYGYGSAMAVFIVVEALIGTLIIQKLFGNDDTN